MGLLAEHREISRAAEDKLTFKLGMIANQRCRHLIDAYDICITNRTVSAAWACKSAYDASQACIRQYVTAENVEIMKRRWIDAGKPRFPDWSALMEGLVPPEQPAGEQHDR